MINTGWYGNRNLYHHWIRSLGAPDRIRHNHCQQCVNILLWVSPDISSCRFWFSQMALTHTILLTLPFCRHAGGLRFSLTTRKASILYSSFFTNLLFAPKVLLEDLWPMIIISSHPNSHTPLKTTGGLARWGRSSGNFDLLFYMIIDLKRSIDLR